MNKLILAALTAMLLNTGCGVSEPKGDYSQAELNQLVAQFIADVRTVDATDRVSFVRAYPEIDVIQRALSDRRVIVPTLSHGGQIQSEATAEQCARILSLAIDDTLSGNESRAAFFWDSYDRNC